MSLQQLLQTRVQKNDVYLQNSVELFKILFKLDQKFKESETKPEELGLDSNQAILGLIDTSKESLEQLCETAKHLKMETSDVFYGMLSDLLEKGMKPQDLASQLNEQIKTILETDCPSKTQEHFVQVYFKHKMVAEISSKDENFDGILESMRVLKDLKSTKLCSTVLQALTLALFLKDEKKSNEVIELAVNIISTKDGISKALKRDLFNLIGRKILQLNTLEIRDDRIDNKSTSS